MGSYMKKRGQVTAIVIVGLVILIIAAVFFVYSNSLTKIEGGTRTSQVRLAELFDAIKKDQIDKCIDSETKIAIKDLIEGGGSFNLVNKLRYRSKDVAVLCQAIPGKDVCLSSTIFLNVVEQKLSQRLTERMERCIDLSAYQGKDYAIEADSLSATATINQKNIFVKINYPVNLRAGVVNFTRSDFVYNVNVPLGEIIKVVNDILNSEAQFGVFEPLTYGLLSLNKYDVTVDKPYPNKIYTAGLTNSDYKMVFAVTGNDRFAKK